MSQPEKSDFVHTALKDLQAIRDDIKVRIHLAGLDAKDAWSKLETEVWDVEQKAKTLKTLPKETVDGVLAKVKSFRDSLHHPH